MVKMETKRGLINYRKESKSLYKTGDSHKSDVVPRNRRDNENDDKTSLSIF